MPGVKPMKPKAETQVGNRLTDDFVYWERMQELSLRVFDTVQCEAISMFTRFKSLVHGAAFRKNGGVLGVGTHEVPVNAVAFAKDAYSILTMANDGSMAFYDLTDPRTQGSLWQIEKAHDDSIGTGQFMELNDNYFITEKIIVSSNDKFLISAGGLVVKIWDLSCGGRFVHALAHHHKTVTSVAFATNGTRLITGGLDRWVNIFSLDSGDYRLIYSTKVANSVLSLAISRFYD
uniref:Uncharacterized protein n=1 Tax=Panagrolaimus davidi TaxID=227884 RepID=A0A914PC24_9BILA